MLILTNKSQGNLFTEDGVLVEKISEVKLIDGLWTTIIQINCPPKPDIKQWLDLLSHLITQPGEDAVHQDDLEYWSSRITKLRHWHDFTDIDDSYLTEGIKYVGKTRVKRGLIDLVGSVGKALFGIATDADMDALRHAVDETKQGVEALYSNQRKMLSVFNKTRDAIDQNTLKIRDIQDEIQYLLTAVEEEMSDIDFLQQELRYATWARRIDVSLSQLETLMNEYQSHRQLYHTQRIALERGWLTEDILPVRILSIILTEISKTNMRVLPYHWYYQSLTIYPIWQLQNELTFQVLIPGLRDNDFIAYHLRYFNVPLADGHLRRIDGRDHIVINTVNGHSFVPTEDNCFGVNPVVCRPPIMNLMDTCESDLISASLTKKCNFLISERLNETISVSQRKSQLNEIILVGYVPTQVTKRCLGQAPIQILINGPSIIHLNSNCSIETPEWRIVNVKEFTTEISLTFPEYIELPKLNITWPKTLSKKVTQKFEHTSTTSLKWEELPDLEEPVFTIFHQSFWKKYGIPLFIGLAGFMVAAFIVLIICLKRRGSRKSQLATQVPDSIVTEPLTMHYRSNTGRISPGSMIENVPYVMDMTPKRFHNPYDKARALLKNVTEN